MMLRMGLVVSWLMVVFGVIRIANGALVALGTADAESMAYCSARWLGTKTPGQAIDQGIYVFIAGVALGVLVTIGRELQLQNRK